MASTVLVTGASGTIGRAIARRFGSAGWHVAVHYKDHQDAAEETCNQIQHDGGEAVLYQADLRDASAVDTMIEQVAARWGSLDVFIANAGLATSRLLLHHSSEAWAGVIETNVTGTFHCLRAAGRIMLRQRAGSVVLVGSHAGFHGSVGQAAYSAAKAGLIGLMRSAAQEWGASNVRVNMVLPGWQHTALADKALPAEDGLADHLLGRTPDLEAVAATIYSLALLSDASGQVWNLDSRVL
jgi:3-oxoacyl-[acyl-carrier protein] reductase